MEAFEWKKEQNCILFRYCVGYPTDSDLVKILVRAKKSLRGTNGVEKRIATKESFIVVQD